MTRCHARQLRAASRIQRAWRLVFKPRTIKELLCRQADPDVSVSSDIAQTIR